MGECMDYDSDREKMVFEINSDYFRLINQKCASDYSDDRLLFFVRLPITRYISHSVCVCYTYNYTIRHL